MTYLQVFQLAETKGYKFDTSWYEQSDETEYLQLCLMQRWLRDEHKIHINIGVTGINYYECSVWRFGYTEGIVVRKIQDTMTELFDNYEEALLEGIFSALKFIP